MNLQAQRRVRMVTLVDEDGCWRRPEDAPRMPNGYDRLSVGGQRDYLHRVSYVAWHGPIPEGKEVNHLCKKRDCGNPAHLQAATHRENMLHGDTIVSRNAAKTSCDNGHEFTTDTTRIDLHGKRHCIPCDKIRKAVS